MWFVWMWCGWAELLDLLIALLTECVLAECDLSECDWLNPSLLTFYLSICSIYYSSTQMRVKGVVAITKIAKNRGYTACTIPVQSRSLLHIYPVEGKKLKRVVAIIKQLKKEAIKPAQSCRLLQSTRSQGRVLVWRTPVTRGSCLSTYGATCAGI